jgi:pimeloyl-ACP methyl ester carboxylesterase
MPGFVPWNSQPLEFWAEKHAKGKFIDLDGRSTHYIEKGEGEPVILIHGFFYDSYMWSRNIDALAEHFKVYAIDLWGSGYSTRELFDCGYHLYAEQVLKFMDGLDIPNAILVGQSMGAGTAIKFCVQNRKRVTKLILVSAAGLPNPMPMTAKFFALPGIGEFFLSLKTDAIRRKNLRDVFIHDKEVITQSYFENVTRPQKIKGSNETGLRMLRRNFIDKLNDEIHQLGKMDVPIMIVWGREDRAIPLECGEKMHRILEGSRLEIIDDTGHVPQSERPEVFNQLALSFLLDR